MTIWVDADSCPRLLREALQKTAKKRGIKTHFVANRKIPLSLCNFVKMTIVEKEDQSCDNFILKECADSDIVVSRDTLLAEKLLSQNITVLNDKGDIFTSETIKERISIRNASYSLREIESPPPKKRLYSHRDKEAFINALDRLLQKRG